MADDQHDYKVSPGCPPLHARFRKGQSDNPGGRSKKKRHALLADALNEQVFVTVDGERRKITKREAPAGKRAPRAEASLRDAASSDRNV
jgi:hypothetical protein